MSNLPLIRFKGFEGDWTTKKLRNISEKVIQKNTDLLFNETFTNSALQGIVSQLDYFDHQISNSVNISSYYIVRPNEFVYNPRISEMAPVGPVNRNKLNRTGVMSPLYYIFRAKNISLEYLEWYFKTNNWHEFMFDNGNSGARSDRFSIKDDEFVEMPIILPGDKAEQDKIGLLFTNIDKNINLKNQEVNKLKQFKQAMLQKMFPKEGETVPEVRFEGFKGEWAEIEIGDIGEVVTGNTPPTKDESNYSKEGILWVTPTDIKGSKTTKTDKMLSETGLIKARTVPSGSILVTSIASIGKNTMILEEAGFNQQINAVVPKREFDSYFLLFLSNHWSNKMKKTAASGTMQIVNRSEFSKIMTKIPSYNEQKKIGKYFNVVDENIQSKQAELDKLTQFKQAMLDKMFV